MREACVEDRTLIWIDSSQRDSGGSGSDYTVSMVEPLRNVVSVRVVEATIPATVMSVGDHNSTLCLHTVAHGSDLPIHPSQVLKAHTAGSGGGAWRSHDSTGKRTYWDSGHDAEHHVAHSEVKVYQASHSSQIIVASGSVVSEVDAICVIAGNHVLELGPTSSYDELARMTVVACRPSGGLQYVCDVDVVAGVYRLPHGKYDSLRDFVNELQHMYAPDKTGIMLDFLASISDKPERTFQMQIDPALVWGHVDTANSAYDHTYLGREHHWCALWSGSSSLKTLGFQTVPAPLTTAGGTFLVSDAQPRYRGRLRGRTMVDLTSERYVWLRCPEVERHMCTGVGKVLQRGIGVFRLDVPGVLNQDRTEYISVIPNQFHPISKLSKLSFRFDMGSRENTPYDFREINHFMLISVSTLRPDSARLYSHLPRTLNPEYEPNVLMYHIQKHDRESALLRSPDLTPAEMRRVVQIHNAALASNSGGS